MTDDVDDLGESLPHILTCGHRWNRQDTWGEMSVILKDEIDGAPAYSVGYWCRLCRAKPGVAERRLGSMQEENDWLRQATASRDW